MDKQDLWILVLAPFVALALALASMTGECKRVERASYSECAVDSWENFGSSDLLYEDKVKEFVGDE